MSGHHGAVAAVEPAIPEADRADGSADGTTAADAASCDVAAAVVAAVGCAAAKQDCEDVWDCRLRGLLGCCDRTNCPSLRGPSSVRNA